MLIMYGSLFILGLLLVFAPRMINHFARAHRERRHARDEYHRQLLESVQNIETAVTPEPEDRVGDTIAAIRNLRQQQETRDAVDSLIDSLDE